MANPLDDLTGKNIIVDDAPLPDRKVLEFVSGDGATLEATDDSVNGRTVITVTATGVSGGTAESITYDNGASSLVAVNAQTAIDELDSNIAALTGVDIANVSGEANWLPAVYPNIQSYCDGLGLYLDALLSGMVQSQTGTPGYSSGYIVQRGRTEDGALVTVASQNRWAVKYRPDPVVDNVVHAVELGSYYIENNRTVVMAVCICAHETSTIANGAELFFRVVASANGSGVVTLSTTRSTSGTNNSVTGGSPEATPATPPGWIAAYGSLVTLDVATANRVKFKVAQNSTTSVTWALTVDAEVRS